MRDLRRWLASEKMPKSRLAQRREKFLELTETLHLRFTCFHPRAASKSQWRLP